MVSVDRSFFSKNMMNVCDVVEESQWVYHRRFFLIDRTSGIVNNGE